MNFYYVYILANKSNSNMCVEVTDNLKNQLAQIDGAMEKLVYFELSVDKNSAVSRQKELQKWDKERKGQLVSLLNPQWNNLAGNLAIG